MSQSASSDQRSKRELRRGVLAVRAALTADDVQESARSLARHVLELPELAHVTSVAAYVSVGTEPGTGPLLEALRDRGVSVLLPLLLPDNDLDWAPYEGPGRSYGPNAGCWSPPGRGSARTP